MQTLLGLAISVFFFSVIVFFFDILSAMVGLTHAEGQLRHRKIGAWGMLISVCVIAILMALGYRAW